MPRSTPDPARLLPGSPTGLSPSLAGLPMPFRSIRQSSAAVHTPPCKQDGLGSSRFARRYSGNHLKHLCFCFLFLRLLRCFSSPGSPHAPIKVSLLQYMVRKVSLRGFPHSDICGSMCMCHSPQLFAAYHVFHRLSVPRHPPCALLRLTLFSSLPLSVASGMLL